MRVFLCLFVVLLILCAGLAHADFSESQRLRNRIEALQSEIDNQGEACAGEAAVLPLYHQLTQLQRQMNDLRGPTYNLDQGGDDCASAFNITSFPFCDTGTTTGYSNRYSPPSNCGSSHAPDVLYLYTPETSITLDVSLCGSSYNTILHIWQDCPDTGLAILVCCNDDSPTCSPQSCCPAVTFEAGHVYYIIVDGSGSESGNYQISLDLPSLPSCAVPAPCDDACVVCPPGATVEAEACPGGYPDPNGGCYSWPIGFNYISCGETWCATSENTASFVDHDAFFITLTQRDSLRFCVVAEFDFEVKFYHYYAGG